MFLVGPEEPGTGVSKSRRSPDLRRNVVSIEFRLGVLLYGVTCSCIIGDELSSNKYREPGLAQCTDRVIVCRLLNLRCKTTLFTISNTGKN